ncbi:protein retinal degeneration B-like isoform X1 [Biomphalaria glabrata]|uniref:Protein retinal degeneration B-like isoform X1 n=3 Tax=Biomphalaria glabrata TaxID=6526 RepID=A0A9W2YFQ2_BIOGL|nr:protein retinal degeneration B-like isoform X1 [Biomphalaria glabrata]XP_055861564.1 protein retinal degeneration B-like isoform X1 [Biomphalaria glabrata]
MLIKEYRISLPMSVEEYRIAQLYMIQKKSRDESHGTDSGVEIIENKPYTNGPGGNGQYTYKIYHIGSHLPGWFRAILPKSALRVEEEAWNAYPYTKTRYKCPFIEKFLLEVETKYHNDSGEDDSVFSLSKSDKALRTVDYIDIVKDSLTGGDYKKEEDPKLYKSSKTGRGPLSDDWRLQYAEALKEGQRDGMEMMTAYKLCRVEFKYWGMQNKIERFIHDVALRKTMLRAHRQAWCWQDEYYGLTLEDIRALERETQLALAEKMAAANQAHGAGSPEANDSPTRRSSSASSASSERRLSHPHHHHHRVAEKSKSGVHFSETLLKDSPSLEAASDFSRSVSQESNASTVINGAVVASSSSPSVLSSQSRHSHSSQRHSSSEGHWSSLEQLQEPSSDEEFFDAQEDVHYQMSFDGEAPNLIRHSSMELVHTADDSSDTHSFMSCVTGDEPQFDKRVEQFRQMYSLDGSQGTTDLSPPQSASSCPTQILFLVLHGGNILDSSQEGISKRRDLTNLRATFDNVILAHYQTAYQRIKFRLVPCPSLCKETLALLSSLSPFNVDRVNTAGSMESNLARNQNLVPLGAIPVLATASAEYQDQVNAMVTSANKVYHDFLKSEDGIGFSGQICFLADATGSLLAYDALTSCSTLMRGGSRYGSHESVESSAIGTETSHRSASMNSHKRELSLSDPALNQNQATGSLPAPKKAERSKSEIVPPDTSEIYSTCKEEPPPVAMRHDSKKYSFRHNSVHLCTSGEVSRRTSSGSHNEGGLAKFDFDVSDFFMCGAPLGIVLAYRKIRRSDDMTMLRPSCHQVYNLFHSSDPTALRIEPLLHEGFASVPPQNVCRYSKFPLGDGEPVHVVETIQKHLKVFATEGREHRTSTSEGPPRMLQRQNSLSSVNSTSSGLGENTVSSITSVTNSWWGVKRIDYVLYCPDALHSFPTNALPHLFHSSFWESTDLVAFILRQVLRQNEVLVDAGHGVARGSMASFKIKSPREKWIKRRTTIKVRNLQPNHRANDVIVLEDMPQVLSAKFMYGSLDITSLSGEKVDVNIMKQPPSGDWTLLGTEVTDSHGRFTYTIPKEHRISQGLYPVKLVVRGDHTSVDFYMAVLPPKTETVVFSIDGSFTASVSIMGKDPKVRAGAVDVVRQWQDLGYLILYVSARPDLQHRKVVAWLAQHNFPHGMVAFMDGLSKDPLKQKFNYIRSLQTEAQIELKAAYGSSKDISIYKDLGLLPHQIFIVGKASKKQHGQAQVLTDGYSAHLNQLMTPGFTRPAVGNARMFLRKSNFRLSMHEPHSRESKKAVKHTSSHSNAGDFLSGSGDILGTKIVVQDFSSSAEGRSRDSSPRLQLVAHGKSTDV